MEHFPKWAVSFFGLILIIHFFLGHLAQGQTEAEMLSDVNEFRNGVDLTCVPYGGSSYYITQSVEGGRWDSKHDQGLRGVYKKAQLDKKCRQIVETNKEGLDTDTKTNNCGYNCILAEMKLLKSSWAEPVTLADDVDAATAKMKEFLTNEPYWNQNISLDLSAEATVRLLLVRGGRYLNYMHPGKLTCRDEAYDGFVRYIHLDVLSWFYCGVTQGIIGFEPTLASVEEAASNTRYNKLWPELSCWKESIIVKIMTETGYQKPNVPTSRALYTWNRECRDQFNNTQFKKEYGGEGAADTCAKMCILTYMGLVERLRGDMVFDGLLRLRRRDYQSFYFDSGDKSGLEEFYHAVNSSHKDDSEAECFQVDRWTPLIRDVDAFFERECIGAPPVGGGGGQKVLPLDGNPSSTRSNKNNNSVSLWPDFKCLPGWYDEDNRDPDHPLAASRSAGPKLLKSINSHCDQWASAQSTADWVVEGCKFSCIMEQLGLVSRNSSTREYYQSDLDTFLEGFTMLLTDAGGFDMVSKVETELFPQFNESYTWDFVAKSDYAKEDICKAYFWTWLRDKINAFSVRHSRGSCMEARRAEKYSDYWEKNHTAYTANLDLSCYDFDYKGIDSGEGDMVPFLDASQECTDFLGKRGLNDKCHTVCMFGKMNILSWDVAMQSKKRGNGSIMGSLNPWGTLSNDLKKFISGSRKTTTTTLVNAIAKLEQECVPVFDRVRNKGCDEMQELEDCIEQTLSCNYSGKFLVQNQASSSSSSSPLAGKSESKRKNNNKVEDYSGFPDMSCRQGYLKTSQPGKGSGLLKKTSLVCKSLVEIGYYPCDKLCMLDQLGILVLNETGGGAAADHDESAGSFTLNNEQELTLRLSAILAGFGGWDASYRIATLILADCSQPLQQLGLPNCNSTAWTRFSVCMNRALECTTALIFTSFDLEALYEYVGGLPSAYKYEPGFDVWGSQV